MTTKILGNQITSYTIDTVQLSNTATAAFAKTLAPKVLYANVVSNTFTVLDDTAVNVGGGYIVVTGAEFQSGATVLIDTTPASAVTYVNSTTLQVQVPTKSASSYNLYVVNPDGGVGIKVSGITYSSEPSWTTASPLANQAANTAFGVNLSATGATSYSVAAGSTLPAGTTLAANGYFSGTVTIGAQTTYSFSVVATDAELQDSSKTFQVTVTVIPATRLYAWGRTNQGTLGLNATGFPYFSSPVLVGSQTTWRQIDVGSSLVVATKTDGTLWSWGNGQSGALGINAASIYRSSPTQVGADTNWSVVSTTFDGLQSAAIKTDGTLWTWGQGAGGSGALGLGNSINISSPTQVGADTNWSKISCFSRSQNMAAIKTDLTLWTWGSGYTGGNGQNSTTVVDSPRQVGSGTNWSIVKGGYYSAVAVKTDGTLWSWGNNGYGQLGHNDTVNKSSPVQVGTATNWSQVNVSAGQHVIITKTDGTLWAWGNNNSGQLGVGGTAYRSSPVQIGSETDWSFVEAGHQNSGAIKTNGTMWLWGSGSYGALGQGNTSGSQSPVQVSGTNWSLVNMGPGRYFAITSN